MVEDRINNLLSKNSVEIKVDRSPWGGDKIVVFRRKLEKLLLAIYTYNASRYITSKHVQIKWFLAPLAEAIVMALCPSLIEEDAHYTVQEIEELSGIHSPSVLKILRKICARWVPHLLSGNQKQSRVRLASQVIEKYDKCDPRRLEEIVTGDETWICHFQPDSKAKNKVSAASNYSMIAHQPINPLRYRNI